ncbi:MAG TPA: hypothetical protein PK462_07835 [Lachnospira sp.]|nr:hypothetical protein [Lachnospira sp.]
MEHSENLQDIEKIFAFNARIIKVIFDTPENTILQADVVEQLTTCKMIHFTMQKIITPKFLELNPDRPDLESIEKSAFDDYDEENGYNDTQDNRNVWQICRENLDRVIKLCVKAFNCSMTECMRMDIMTLLDHVKFEIETAHENK